MTNLYRKGSERDANALWQAVCKFLLGCCGSLKFVVSAASFSGCSLKNIYPVLPVGLDHQIFLPSSVTGPGREGNKTNILIWGCFWKQGRVCHVSWKEKAVIMQGDADVCRCAARTRWSFHAEETCSTLRAPVELDSQKMLIFVFNADPSCCVYWIQLCKLP